MSGEALNRGDTSTTATIATSGTVSSAVDFRAAAFGGIALPAAFTGTALTFQVSADNTTYQALNDRYGAAVSMTVAQGKSYPLPTELAGWPWFKIVSGSTEGGNRTIVIVRKR